MLGIVATGTGALERFLARRLDRLSHLQRHDARVALDVVLQALGHTHHALAPLGEARQAVATKGRGGARHDRLDVGVGVRLVRGERVARGRVDRSDRHSSSRSRSSLAWRSRVRRSASARRQSAMRL